MQKPHLVPHDLFAIKAIPPANRRNVLSCFFCVFVFCCFFLFVCLFVLFVFVFFSSSSSSFFLSFKSSYKDTAKAGRSRSASQDSKRVIKSKTKYWVRLSATY